MLQYLLNTTAIWLISLVLFDVFLRKESYHGYNRSYLLFTFLLGAFLPLWQWQDNNIIYNAAMQRPLDSVIAAKHNIITAGSPSSGIGWEQWLAVLYLAGAFIALCLLIVDIIKLAAFYRSGKKSEQDSWTIIETGKEHAPFSFLNTLFVSSCQQYSDDEWNMILAHERRHTTLLHFSDLLLLQIARIVFWFHPLVYVYNKRLLLVHEYQADHTAIQQPQVYGRFLVEQAVLQAAPSISHSFNRSPIKKRIVMLTRKSSAASRVKMLVFIPLTIACIVCFSKNSYSNRPKKHGNVIEYNGNTIELLPPKKPDSYLYKDPETGKSYRKPIEWPNPPIKLNGQKIYNPDQDKNVTKPEMKGKYTSIAAYLLQNARKEFEQLADGDYFILISKVVVDEKGKVVYFENEGIFQDKEDMDKQPRQKKLVDKKLNALMDDAPVSIPASCDGKPVAYLIDYLFTFTYGYESPSFLTVKEHKITAIKN